MNDRLKALYQTVILKHSKAPVNYQKRADADIIVDANNPVCGDRFKLFLDIKEEQIVQVHFYGHGCAISKASCSILVKNLIGKTIAEAQAFCSQMQVIVDPSTTDQHPNEELAAFEAARHFPERASCATLSWDKTKAALEQLA